MASVVCCRMRVLSAVLQYTVSTRMEAPRTLRRVHHHPHPAAVTQPTCQQQRSGRSVYAVHYSGKLIPSNPKLLLNMKKVGLPRGLVTITALTSFLNITLNALYLFM